MTPRSRLALILVLGALTCLGSFTIDLYLPALPEIGDELGASAGLIQLTITATALGLAAGQIIVGPLSDRIGRKGPLVAGALVHVVASIAIALGPSIEWITAARFGQGFGAAASTVVAGAMVRDLYSGRPLVRMTARLALVSGMAPIVAPFLGSQLLRLVDWRGIFALLALYSLTMGIICGFALRETHPSERRAAQASSSREKLRALATDRIFVGIVLINCALLAVVLTYISTSPFVLQVQHGLTPQQFGVVFALACVALFVANQGAARAMHRWEPARLLAIGLPVVAIAGAALVVAQACEAGIAVIGPLFAVLLASTGFCQPCATVTAMVRHGARAGSAAAVLGFSSSLVGALVAPLPGLLGVVSASAIGVVAIAAGGVAVAMLWLVVRPSTVPPLADEQVSCRAV